MGRSKLITRLPVAALNASLTKEVFDEKVAALIRDLYIDLPALKTLRASRLVERRENLITGLCLGIYLDETEQMSMPYPGDRFARAAVTDLFLQDLEMVEQQQDAIRNKVSKAISPFIDPAGDAAVVRIRRRLKRTRRNESFLLPIGPEAEVIQHDKLPKILPRGYLVNVRVRVNWIAPKFAEVLILEAFDLEGSNRSDLPRGTKIKLIREGTLRRQESGSRLLEAMDGKRVLSLKVTMAINWISGEPSFLELIEFLDDCG